MSDKLEKVLSRDKVVDVLDNLSRNFCSPDVFYSSNNLEDQVRRTAAMAADAVVREFCFRLKDELKNCAPDSYPCALCYDADDEPNIT